MTDTPLTPEAPHTVTTAAVDPATAALPAAAPPAPAAAPGGLLPAHVDPSTGFLHGSQFVAASPSERTGPAGRPREEPIPAFRASGEQMAALLPPKRPAPEQPDAGGWLASVTSTDIIRSQQALLALTLTAGPTLTAELVAERQRRAAAAAADLQRRAAALPSDGRALAAQKVYGDLLREATDAKNEARKRLGAFLSARSARPEAPAAVVNEVLLTALHECDVLSLRARLAHLSR